MTKRRSRTREARQRRQKQRRQNRRLALLIAIVMVAVVAIAVFVVSNQPVEAYVAEDLSARYENIERSFSAEGYPRLGDSDAPVNLTEYASFACPGCEAIHSASIDAILERVRDGQVRFTYVPLQTGSVPNAEGASRAALCAGQEDMFWEMHDVLFDWQTRYGNTAFSQNRLLAGIEALDLSAGAFTDCFNSAAINNILDAALNEDVSTTPTIRVNGVTLEAGQAIPSTEAILRAIDEATPADWGLPAEEPVDAEAESEAAAQAEVDAPATETPQEPAPAQEESPEPADDVEPTESESPASDSETAVDEPTSQPANAQETSAEDADA